MSDVSPYGVTQNADAALVTADALVGTHAGTQRENAAVGSAAMFSTAPYIPPRSQREGFCRGKNDTCMAKPIRGTNLCVFHSPGQARADRIGDE
jgi:hypothetical protein